MNNKSMEASERCNLFVHLGCNVDEFIKYSDSLDRRMLEIAGTYADVKDKKWNTWSHRDAFNEDSDSEEEHTSNIPPKFPVKDTKNSKLANDHISLEERDEDVLSDCTNKEFCGENAAHSNQEIFESVGSASDRDSVEQLVKKFGVIEQLRQRDHSKKEKEPEYIKLSSTTRKEVYEDINGKELRAKNPEEFFGKSKCAKKRQNEVFEDKSESLCDEEDNEIDKIAEMLSNSSLIKDYNDIISFPNKEDEILQNFLHKTEEEEEEEEEEECQLKDLRNYISEFSFDDIPTQSEEKSPMTAIEGEAFSWKDTVSKEVNILFDGYEIDDPSSFHDWMIDDILSRSLKSSKDVEFTICSSCCSIHDRGHECSAE